MLIDNKKPYSSNRPESESVTLYHQIKYKLSRGGLKMVSGYYSLQAFAQLLDELNELESVEMILGHIAESESSPETYAIKNDSLSIRQSLNFAEKIDKVVSFLEQSKVQIRTKSPDFCHAKAYVFKGQDCEKSFAVSGSSNFTPSGLGIKTTGNIELNHYFGYESPFVAQLEEWFDRVYKTAKDNKQEVIDELKNFYKQNYTPLEIYSLILYHLFDAQRREGQDVVQQVSRNKKLTESVIWNKLFDFQQKGVIGLIQKLEKYNFALLGDGVGLGKTWQTLAVIKHYLSKGEDVLVISPKKLEQNWLKYKYHKELEDAVFYDDKLEFEYLPLSQLAESNRYNNRKLDKYDLIVIDESHNLRNSKSKKYQFLVDKILKGGKNSKVLLLSATPLNNKVSDVYHQFNLGFCHEYNNFGKYFDYGLKGAFDNTQKVLNACYKNKLDNHATIKELTLKTKLFELVDSFCIARTRSVIKKCYPNSNIKFPKAQVEWKPLEYFEKALEVLMDRDRPKINFSIYKVSRYLDETQKQKLTSGSALDNEINREQFLSKMMMINLIKRLESSVYAFEKTLDRIIAYHEYLLKLHSLYLQSKEMNQFGSKSLFDAADESQFSNEDVEEGDSDELDILEEMVIGFSKTIKEQVAKLRQDPASIREGFLIGSKKPKNFKELKSGNLYISNVKKELEKLKEIKTVFNRDYGKDELDIKILLLKQSIDSHLKNGSKKIIIFTTYADTAKYIYKNLTSSSTLEHLNFELVTGGNTRIDQQLRRFSPKSMIYNELSKTEREKYSSFEDFWIRYDGPEKDNPVDILIATDCISEGQNLQDCDCLINYDIHWNPVRLVQRNGRIDRIGSGYEKVFITNFLPGKSLEEVLQLKSRLDYKMALVGMVGGVDGDKDARTEAIVKFWQKASEDAKKDIQLFSEEEANQILQKHLISDTDKIEYLEVLKKIQDSSFADFRELQMLKLMESNYDDIEDNNLGINNFSFQEFYLELDNLLKQRQGMDKYPAGIYSGATNDSQEGVILLLKSKESLNKEEQKKRLASNPKFPYVMYMIDFKGQIKFKYDNLPQILEMLKMLKDSPRNVPGYLEPGQNMDMYEKLIFTALDSYKKDFEARELKSFFGGGQLSAGKKFDYDNFELVTWFIVSKN